MKIVAISDTHERHKLITLPEGDVLVHAGDITKNGSVEAIRDFARWMQDAPHKSKIVIAGNHDFCFENENAAVVEKILADHGICYLFDSGVSVGGIKFWVARGSHGFLIGHLIFNVVTKSLKNGHSFRTIHKCSSHMGHLMK